ncbi:MAG: hypothetical protein WC366_01820 [Bacilli bacterium]|jgi:ABC-type Na+ efflux pump permease subunit
MHVLATDIWTSPWFIISALLVFFGLIVLIVILAKRATNKNKTMPKIDEEDARKEQLNRVLEPITDEETLKQMEKYEQEAKQSAENKQDKNK